MTIHFFTKGDASVPSSRTRVYYLAKELERRGHKTNIQSLGASADGGATTRTSVRSFLRHLHTLRAIPVSDPLVLQRTIYDPWFLLAALTARFLFGRRFFFDIDDATFLHSKWKMIALARAADAVICAGAYVANWARKQNPRIVIIPTGIDLTQIREATRNCHRNNPEPVIGWVGNGPAHWDNLVFIAPVFQRLMNKGVRFRFTLIGTFDDARIPALFAFLGDRLRTINRLPPADVFPEICQFDIGIMPLKPDPWANAKYLKTVEYMACGVPPVSSRLGENAHIIRHGENGLLALTENEWVEALRFLLEHPADRARMGQAATHDAAAFDITKNADRFLEMMSVSAPKTP